MTRLSLGVQSLDEDPCCSWAEALGLGGKEAAVLASEVFDRFSLDVIYGLPGQSQANGKGAG